MVGPLPAKKLDRTPLGRQGRLGALSSVSFLTPPTQAKFLLDTMMLVTYVFDHNTVSFRIHADGRHAFLIRAVSVVIVRTSTSLPTCVEAWHDRCCLVVSWCGTYYTTSHKRGNERLI